MTAYYNENNPKKAAVLRELIRRDVIAPGDVDERDIRDVVPSELARYTQCHFFAGIGVWSYALRLAGWPDDKPVWTGSCPCQPFSAAGRRKGTADERHLWPAWFWLIEQSKPRVVYGEQVSGKDGLAWFDDVLHDLEGSGYAVRAADLPASGFGAPHRRQRLYFVADTASVRRYGWRTGEEVGRPVESERLRDAGGVEHSEGDGRDERGTEPGGRGAIGGRGPVNGFWADCEWIWCRDGKWRSTEPGSFPLAHGAAARVLRLSCYGYAIVAPQAAAFIEVTQD